MDNRTVILRITDGILDGEKYMLLKKLAGASDSDCKFFILTVSPDDLDMLSKMVTTAAFFIDENTLCALCEGGKATVMLKKLCIAVKYMLLPFKTVVDYGDGRQERDCTLSIVTPSVHIHVPLSLGDKKTERFVASAILGAKKLLDENKSEYLAYCDEETEQLVFESKDDYVRRKYFDSGLVEDLEKASPDIIDK
ncbi:MAG: hypothetical protein E7656_05855 [Ruminococcaceae bacterium]|nr:hypothetical protein [Oscillospiraceae bacterium]